MDISQKEKTPLLKSFRHEIVYIVKAVFPKNALPFGNRISELLVLKEIFKCEFSDFFKGLPKPEKFTEN